MAFRLQEPSDALMEAMRMRVGAKVYGEQSDGGVNGGAAAYKTSAAAPKVTMVASAAGYAAVEAARASADSRLSGRSKAYPLDDFLPGFRAVEGSSFAPTVKESVSVTASGANTSANTYPVGVGQPAFSTTTAVDTSRPSSTGSRPQLQPRARALPPGIPEQSPSALAGGDNVSASASSSAGAFVPTPSPTSRPPPAPRLPPKPSGQAAAAAAAAAEAAANAASDPSSDAASAAFAAAAAAVAAAEEAVSDRGTLLPTGEDHDLYENPDAVAAAPTPSAASAYGGAMPVYGGVVPRLPSAVCLAGVPVAADGNLVYLGGGLYAAASAPANREQNPVQSVGKPRVMPGRVRQPPPKSRGPRPLGPRSAVRSASAHLVGSQSARASGDLSPTPSRAQSEGQLQSGEDGASGMGGGNGNRGNKTGGANAWRPSGVARRPPTPDKPAISSARRSPLDAHGPSTSSGLIPGGASEQRAAARREAAREVQSSGLFGQQGILAQIREGEAHEARRLEALQDGIMMPAPSFQRAAPSGPPQNGAKRDAERRAMKEAKVQMMLEERAARLGAVAEEAKEKRALVRQAASTRSMPEFPQARLASNQDMERQKNRVACKLEILELLNGYNTSAGKAGKASIEQTQALLARLQESGGETEDGDIGGGNFEGEALSVQERLRLVSDSCNEAFREPDFEDHEL